MGVQVEAVVARLEPRDPERKYTGRKEFPVPCQT